MYIKYLGEVLLYLRFQSSILGVIIFVPISRKQEEQPAVVSSSPYPLLSSILIVSVASLVCSTLPSPSVLLLIVIVFSI